MDEIAEGRELQRVPPESLELGGVYQLHSRNLAFGVYAGDGEFIGIRTKFAKRFVEHYARNLDQEWDWDTHEGTATPLMKVGKIAVGIELMHGYNPPEGRYRMNQDLFDALDWFEGTYVEGCRCLHPHRREDVDFSHGPWRQPLCGWCSGAAENEDPGFVPVTSTEPQSPAARE